jgi:hypothetical protein
LDPDLTRERTLASDNSPQPKRSKGRQDGRRRLRCRGVGGAPGGADEVARPVHERLDLAVLDNRLDRQLRCAQPWRLDAFAPDDTSVADAMPSELDR